jgi:5-methylcytosine-specific restriction endonuclease McrA
MDTATLFPIPQTKRCAKCREFKPLNAFGNYKRTTDGKRWECKLCRKTRYENNRETILSGQAISRANRTEEQRRAKKAKDAADFKVHQQERQASNRRKRAENPEKFFQYDLNYRVKNSTHLKALRVIWKKENRARLQALEARRRARKANAPLNDLTPAQWEEVLTAFNHRCAYCPPDCKECKKKAHILTQDHVTPYARNGSHTLWNVVPACGRCNSRKRDRKALTAVQPLLLTIAPSKPLKKKKR